jgi:hypothetical protein
VNNPPFFNGFKVLKINEESVIFTSNLNIQNRRYAVRNEPLFKIWHGIQNALFPWLEKELDPLTEKQQELARVIELAEFQKHMSPYLRQGIGRKRDDRLAILKAFAAKAGYNFPTTKVLIAYLHDSPNLRWLYGWESKGGYSVGIYVFSGV